MFKITFGTALACSALIFATPAMATTTIWDGTGANATLPFSQFGTSGTLVNSGTAFTTTNGITGTVTSSTKLAMDRRTQGADWGGGSFAPGAALLYNRSTAGDITFTFAQALTAVGAQFNTDYLTSFIARITLNDGSTLTLPGTAGLGSAGTSIFIGAKSDTASIQSITFHQDSGGGGNDFALGELSIDASALVAAAPEPATWAMMIIGFGIAGVSLRRRRAEARVAHA